MGRGHEVRTQRRVSANDICSFAAVRLAMSYAIAAQSTCTTSSRASGETVDGDNEDGDRPSPRAAHASVAIGNQWFVIGGGDNESAIQDAYTFDLRACVDERKCRWTLFAESCALIGKEGMSASAVVSPSSKRVFLLLHGGLNEKGAVCDTIACRLAPLASH